MLRSSYWNSIAPLVAGYGAAEVKVAEEGVAHSSRWLGLSAAAVAVVSQGVSDSHPWSRGSKREGGRKGGIRLLKLDRAISTRVFFFWCV